MDVVGECGWAPSAGGVAGTSAEHALARCGEGGRGERAASESRGSNG